MPRGLRVARWLKVAVGATFLGLTFFGFSAVAITVLRVGPNVSIGCLFACHPTDAYQPAEPIIRWRTRVLTIPAPKPAASEHKTKTAHVARSSPRSHRHVATHPVLNSPMAYSPASPTIRTSLSSKLSIKTHSTSQTSSITSGGGSGTSSATATGSASGSASSCTAVAESGTRTRSSGCP